MALAHFLFRSALGVFLAVAFAQTGYASCYDHPKPGVDWSGCHKRSKKLKGKDLTGGKFANTDFSYSTLRDVNFKNANLHRAVLVKASLANANLEGADMSKAQGMRANIQRAVLDRANLTKSEFSRADFANASLIEANLSKANFSRAIFSAADFSGANFSYSNISRADFRGAVLTGANFQGAYTLHARFEGADISDTLGLSYNQLSVACGNDATLLPSGVKRPDSWPCE